FFEAEDGIRDATVTGVQTCALPILDYESQFAALLEETRRALPHVRLIVLEPFVLRCGAVDDRWFPEFDARRAAAARVAEHADAKIGRASCRERGEGAGVGGRVQSDM